MNILWNTQMHWLTLVFIAIETIFLFIQVWDIFRYPHERKQWWYLILLLLLLFFNWANGLFPDLSWKISLKLQYMIAYGFAYLIGAYFPFYFYIVFELDKLRSYATYGAVIFIIVPYLVFDVVLYAQNSKLVPDREWGVLIPFIYGLVILTLMLRVVTQKYKDGGERKNYLEALAVWIAMLPWQAMSIFAFFPAPQWTRILFANFGWLVITLIKMAKAIKQSHRDKKEKDEQAIAGMSQEEFLANCLHFGLTRMEILVTQWVYKGKSSKEIAEILSSTEDTVNKHIHNAFRKTGARNRVGLIHKLLNRRG